MIRMFSAPFLFISEDIPTFFKKVNNLPQVKQTMMSIYKDNLPVDRMSRLRITREEIIENCKQMSNTESKYMYIACAIRSVTWNDSSGRYF